MAELPMTTAGTYPGECGQPGRYWRLDGTGPAHAMVRCEQHIPPAGHAILNGHTGPCCWMEPRRIQRRRTAGWQCPPMTRIVTRPTVFGNPFIIGTPWCLDAETAVALHRVWLELGTLPDGFEIDPRRFPKGITSMGQWRDTVLTDMAAELSGRVLACWCPEDQPWCHADTYIDLANRLGT